ncbi:protodermal factor 1-like [Solanum pennellii]|uniref:Protodermal factor 1-like n=1 Tax=Solanum pennellii TaxID=28526 RepID=A0ABM1H9N7_SOLPN|nr:protodermal factor 1-like [Solanum pennellii]
MAKQRSSQSSRILWAAFAAMLLQNLVIPVVSFASFEEEKNYYTPDPHTGSPPTGSSTPPYHATPSHGSGSHESKPPANCGNPPKGGQHHDPTPASPSGGYYPHPPSTPTPTPSTPSTPTIVTPPTTPIIDPGTPSTPATPTPSPPFTCDYWRTHPGLIWGLFGWWGNVGSAFGVASAPGLGSNMNLLQALSNQHTDGLGQLYREGTASLLNSMVSKRFSYSTTQVKNNFATALSSDSAAAAQAQLFKLANQGRLKPSA